MPHKQGYNDRLDDALGARHGHKSQSMEGRRHESEGMSKYHGLHEYAGDHQMDHPKDKNNKKHYPLP